MSSTAEGEYVKWRSPALGRDMELKVYGRSGKPAIVFPSGGGRFFEFQDFGMVDACRAFLETGRLQLFAVDSVDHESWLNRSLSPAGRVRRHEQYESYVLREVLPFVRERNRSGGGVMTMGCSGGGFHAVNHLFRHPEMFDTVLSLSGVYSHRWAFGDAWDDSIYFHFPLAYLSNLGDPRLLALLRRSSIVFAVGQGAWETCDQYDCIGDARRLKEILDSKGVPCWADFWGHDVDHDWSWWRKMAPYFLNYLV